MASRHSPAFAGYLTGPFPTAPLEAQKGANPGLPSGAAARRNPDGADGHCRQPHQRGMQRALLLCRLRDLCVIAAHSQTFILACRNTGRNFVQTRLDGLVWRFETETWKGSFGSQKVR